MPVIEFNDETKLAKALAKLDSIQHPKGLKFNFNSRPPLHPDHNFNSRQSLHPDHNFNSRPPLHPDHNHSVDKLPELTPKALTNYKVLKDRVETPTSKLVSKYWSQNKDRFANLSRLSAETAPGALQTVLSSTENSPVQSRVVTPKAGYDKTGANNKPELTIFKTSRHLAKQRLGKNPKLNATSTTGNKYQMLRSRSFADDIHEEEHEDDEHTQVTLTIQDLTAFSHKTMAQAERVNQLSPMKTKLYNSFVDVKKFRRFLKEPEPSFVHEYTERKYINFCDEQKTVIVEQWLEEVTRVQRKEGYWTETIDKSLIRQAIPKHVPADLKNMKAVIPLSESSNASSKAKITV